MIITYTSNYTYTRARAVSRVSERESARREIGDCPRPLPQTHTHTGRTAPADPRHRRGPTTAHPAVRKA